MNPLTIKPSQPATTPPGSPPPGSTIKVVAPQPRSAKSVLLLRFILLLAVIVSAALVYWAYAQRLQPVTAEQREKTSEMTRIADEIEQLRFKWGPQQIEQTRAEYDAVKATLFAGADEIEAWKSEVRSEADMHVVEIQEEIGQAIPHNKLTNEVAILPVTLEAYPQTILVSTNTPYSRVVSFATDLMAGDKRFELVEFSVEGNSNSVAQAVAVVNLFTTTTAPE